MSAAVLIACGSSKGDPASDWESGAKRSSGEHAVAAALGTFETDVSSADGAQWLELTDRPAGGKSSVQVSRTDGGANGTGGALRITGDVPLDGFPFPFGGVRLALGPVVDGDATPVDISGYRGLEFWARGDGKPYTVRMLAAEVTDFNHHHYAFTAGPTWEHHRVPFAELAQFDWGSKLPWTGKRVKGLMFTNFNAPGEEPGSIELVLDEVRLFE